MSGVLHAQAGGAALASMNRLYETRRAPGEYRQAAKCYVRPLVRNSGSQSCNEVQRIEYDVRGAITIRGLQHTSMQAALGKSPRRHQRARLHAHGVLPVRIPPDAYHVGDAGGIQQFRTRNGMQNVSRSRLRLMNTNRWPLVRSSCSTIFTSADKPAYDFLMSVDRVYSKTRTWASEKKHAAYLIRNTMLWPRSRSMRHVRSSLAGNDGSSTSGGALFATASMVRMRLRQ